jgi:hypothetical protein
MKNKVNKALYDNLYKKTTQYHVGQSVYEDAVLAKRIVSTQLRAARNDDHSDEGVVHGSRSDTLDTDAKPLLSGSGRQIEEDAPINLFSTSSRHGQEHDCFVSQMAIAQITDARQRKNLNHQDSAADQSTCEEVDEQCHSMDPPLLYTVYDAHFESMMPTIEDFYRDSPSLLHALQNDDKLLLKDNVSKVELYFNLLKDFIKLAVVKIGRTTATEERLKARYQSYMRSPEVKIYPFENCTKKSSLILAETYIHDHFGEQRVIGTSSCFEGFQLFDTTNGKSMRPIYDEKIRSSSTQLTFENGKMSLHEKSESNNDIMRANTRSTAGQSFHMKLKVPSMEMVHMIREATSHVKTKTAVMGAQTSRPLCLDKNRLCPYNILWVGLKDVNAVVAFYEWFHDKYPALDIIIHVVEDVVDIKLPSDKSDLADHIVIHKTDFMFFNLNDLFDMVFISVKRSLSNTLKLKFFVFASYHFRSEQPLFIIGDSRLFNIESVNEPDKKNPSKPFLPPYVTTMMQHHLNKCPWSFVMVVGDNVWGTIIAGRNIKIPYRDLMLAELQRRLTQERTRMLAPYLSCSYFDGMMKSLPENNIVDSIMFLGRTLTIPLSEAFIAIRSKVLKEYKGVYKQELLVALHYQVSVIIHCF